MNNAIIFLHHRAGSTVFQHLVNHTPQFAKGKYLGGRSSFFPSVPEGVCKIRHVPIGSLKEAIKEADKNQLLLTHVGNWWGETSSDKIPAPYDDPTFVKWGKGELFELVPSGWSFYTLLRDGRNIVESLRCLKGGIEEKRMRETPSDYFIFQCKAFRNKARLALDARRVLPYKILRFEDMLRDPVFFMTSLARDLGLKINLSEIERLGSNITKRKMGRGHTSFKDDSKMNVRWSSWTKEEIRIFKTIAGQELIELGYEKNDGW